MKAHKSTRMPNAATSGIGDAPSPNNANNGSLTTRAQEDAVSAHDHEATTLQAREISLTSRPSRGRARRPLRRWITVGLAAIVAGAMALVASPAGAAPPAPQISLVTGFQGSATVSVGHPKPAASAQISPTYVAYNSTTGDQVVASTADGATFVYLIAGAHATAGEYGITGTPIAGDAYLVAGDGTAGLVADPGSSPTPVATDNPVAPTSVAFDNNGNLVIGGSVPEDLCSRRRKWWRRVPAPFTASR